MLRGHLVVPPSNPPPNVPQSTSREILVNNLNTNTLTQPAYRSHLRTL